MSYNLTGMSGNVTGLLSLFQVVNSELMFGWLGVCILFAATSIALITFLWATNDAGKSFIASTFISFTLSILLRAVDLVPDLAIFISLIGLALSIAIEVKT